MECDRDLKPQTPFLQLYAADHCSYEAAKGVLGVSSRKNWEELQFAAFWRYKRYIYLMTSINFQ